MRWLLLGLLLGLGMAARALPQELAEAVWFIEEARDAQSHVEHSHSAPLCPEATYKYSAAINKLDAALAKEKTPEGNACIRLFKCLCLYDQKHYDEAIPLLERLELDHPGYHITVTSGSMNRGFYYKTDENIPPQDWREWIQENRKVGTRDLLQSCYYMGKHWGMLYIFTRILSKNEPNIREVPDRHLPLIQYTGQVMSKSNLNDYYLNEAKKEMLNANISIPTDSDVSASLFTNEIEAPREYPSKPGGNDRFFFALATIPGKKYAKNEIIPLKVMFEAHYVSNSADPDHLCRFCSIPIYTVQIKDRHGKCIYAYSQPSTDSGYGRQLTVTLGDHAQFSEILYSPEFDSEIGNPPDDDIGERSHDYGLNLPAIPGLHPGQYTVTLSTTVRVYEKGYVMHVPPLWVGKVEYHDARGYCDGGATAITLISNPVQIEIK